MNGVTYMLLFKWLLNILNKINLKILPEMHNAKNHNALNSELFTQGQHTLH